MTEEDVLVMEPPVRNHESLRNGSALSQNRVLVVEPDAALGLFLKREMGHKGYQVGLCCNGEQAVQGLRTSEYDLVIQDIDLPGEDGMHLLRSLSDQFPHLPVMVLTARNRKEDRVRALDLGAYDYIMKPFSFVELQARVRALLRRASTPPLTPAQPTRTSQLCLSKEDRRVLRGDRRIDLTPREFALLEHLVENEGKAVSRASLMQEVWNVPFDPSTNIVDVYMKYLRDKIDTEGEPKLIRTVRGIGYMLDSSLAA